MKFFRNQFWRSSAFSYWVVPLAVICWASWVRFDGKVGGSAV